MTVDIYSACPCQALIGLTDSRMATCVHNIGHTMRRGGRVLFVFLLMTLLSPMALAADFGLGNAIEPVPLNTNLDPQKVALGRSMFNDSRLSGGNGVSCASCHFLNSGLTDRLPVSRGLPGYPGVVNTPSLFNVGLNSRFTWSGRLWTLEDHTRGVIESRTTMGAKWEDVIAILSRDTGLMDEFAAVFKDGLNPQNVIDVIVAYEQSLNTPNAPFDRYLRGDQAAIGEDAKQGFELFKNYGCVSCHQGVNVGGNMLQVFGIFGKTKAAAKGSETPGSATKTGISDDRPVFRVPSLRNVAHTAPYFHDGSATTLRKAIDIMASNQLGRHITDLDAARLEAFLRSLTGEYQGVSLDDL
ncbi:cytochrome-c peroxidase [Rhizobium terrae]|uniref:cytochrome-c peroxidase n=1 Tax=Rhizobium terrae TaxID=2171756 RepID=UPI0013C35DCE|nr:cytochrome c peroxidase [Rhizobium terrae]